MSDNNNGSGSSGDGVADSEFDDLNGTADRFARLLVDSFPAAHPDDSVWEGIQARIATNSRPERNNDVLPLETSSNQQESNRLSARRFVPLLAVAAVAMALVGSLFVVQNSGQNATVAASDGVVRQLADPTTGELAMSVITSDDGSSFASSSTLPALGPNETYQLWSVIGDEVVSVGLLGTDLSSVEFRIEGEPAVLALTVEVAGGVAVSEATPVAVWQSS